MRYKPTLLISIRLNATIPFFGQCILRPCFPWSICITGTEPAFFHIKHIMIGLPFFIKELCIFFFSQRLCQLSHTPVCISIFQSIRNTQRFRCISQQIIPKLSRRVDCILICFFHIVCANSFHISVCQHRQCRITYHTTGIRIQKFPTFIIFPSALICHRYQWIQRITHQMRIDHRL